MREEGDSLCSLLSVASAHPILNQNVTVPFKNTRIKRTFRERPINKVRGSFSSSASGDVLANLMSLANTRINSHDYQAKSLSRKNNNYKTALSRTLPQRNISALELGKGKRLFSPDKKNTVSVLEAVLQEQPQLDSVNSLMDSSRPLQIHPVVRRPFKRIDQKKTPMKYHFIKNALKIRQQSGQKILQKEESNQYHPRSKVKVMDIHNQDDIDCNSQSSKSATLLSKDIEMTSGEETNAVSANHGDIMNIKSPISHNIDESSDQVKPNHHRFGIVSTTRSDKFVIHKDVNLPSNSSTAILDMNLLKDEFNDLNMSMSKMTLDEKSVHDNKELIISSSPSKSSEISLITNLSPLYDACNQISASSICSENITSRKTSNKSPKELTFLRRSSRPHLPVHRLGYVNNNHHDSKQPQQRQLDCEEKPSTQYQDSCNLKFINRVSSIKETSTSSSNQMHLIASAPLDYNSENDNAITLQNQQQVRRSSRDRKPVSRLSITFKRRRKPKLFYVCDITEEVIDLTDAHDEKLVNVFDTKLPEVIDLTDAHDKNVESTINDANDLVANDVHLIDEQDHHIGKDFDNISPTVIKETNETGNLQEQLGSKGLSKHLLRRSQRTRKLTQRLVVTFNRPQQQNCSTPSPDDINSDSDSQDHDVSAPTSSGGVQSSQTEHHESPLIKSFKVLNQECGTDLGWTDDDIQKLKNAYCIVNPMSSHFWYDIASQLPGKSAEECRSMWFSMIKTPCNKSLISAKKSVLQKARGADLDDSFGSGDDIFDSTPFRVLFHVDSETKKLPNSNRRSGGRVRFSLEFDSPIVKSDDEVNESMIDGKYGDGNNNEFIDDPYEIYNSSPIICRANTKGYLQKLKAGWKDDIGSKLHTTKKKPRQKIRALLNMDDAMARDVMDSIDVGDVHMNGVLSPGGTLHIQAPDELELEELYIPSDDEI